MSALEEPSHDLERLVEMAVLIGVGEFLIRRLLDRGREACALPDTLDVRYLGGASRTPQDTAYGRAPSLGE